MKYAKNSIFKIGALPWVIVFCVLLYILYYLQTKSVSFSPDSIGDLALRSLIFSILIGSSWVFRSREQVSLLFETFAFLMISWTTLRIFNHIVMIGQTPLADPILAEWDRWLGFDWLAYVLFIDRHPLIIDALQISYHGLTNYTAFFIGLIFLASDDKQASLHEFLSIFAITAVLASAIGSAFPAVAAAEYYQPAVDQFKNINPNAGSYHLNHLFNLRSGNEIILDMASLPGLTTFPSFHTAMGVICIYCTRRNAAILGFSLILNMLMILSTPVAGAHYMIDIIAGAILAVAVIWFYRLNLSLKFSLAPRIFKAPFGVSH